MANEASVFLGLFCMAVTVSLLLLGMILLARALKRKSAHPARETYRPWPVEGQPMPPFRGGPVRPAFTSAACPACGASLPEDSPQGLCPRCLLQGALAGAEPAAASRVSPADSRGPVVAPEPAALAPHFPHLEIQTLLGVGGMGAVYKARQLKLDRFVALKILPPEWGRDPAFAERFAREARAMARLTHPHIVAVHDFGEAGGYFYLLMEYVDGANLRQVLQTGPMEPAQALQVIPQVCEALQYAHEEGVVHRDIKPENILLDRKGRVKIADFGLAKLVGPSQASFTLTGTHQVMGTLDYMAPEQRNRPQEVDHRADIYSLGVVFYEMLTGELPLGRFSPPSEVAAVDGRLDQVVFRALEREPGRRYQRASEVKSELESLAGRAPAPAVPVAAAAPHLPEAEQLQFQVRGPAAALFVTAAVAVASWLVIGLAILGSELSSPPYARVDPGLILSTFTLGAMVVLGLAGTIVAGARKMRRFESYEMMIVAAILAMVPWSPHVLIGIPAGIWTLTLTRPEMRAVFAAKLRRRRRPAELAYFRAKGAAAALGVTAAAAAISWMAIGTGIVLSNLAHPPYVPPTHGFVGRADMVKGGPGLVLPPPPPPQRYGPTTWTEIAIVAGVEVVVLSLAGAILAGALKLRRCTGYELVIVAAILAMLPWSPHALIGIPAGIYCFITLSRPEVRAAFAANMRFPPAPAGLPDLPPAEPAAPEVSRPTGPFRRGVRSFLRSLRSAFISSPHAGEPLPGEAPHPAAGDAPPLSDPKRIVRNGLLVLAVVATLLGIACLAAIG
jgi:hypothetical protein